MAVQFRRYYSVAAIVQNDGTFLTVLHYGSTYLAVVQHSGMYLAALQYDSGILAVLQ